MPEWSPTPGSSPLKIARSVTVVATDPERILATAAAQLMPGAPDVEAPADDATGAQLVSLATSQGLLGPLLIATDDSPTWCRDEIVEHHTGAMLWCMELELRLLQIDDWFRDAGGIEYLVLKGPSVAHLDELDPSLRSFADIDLLIRARDIDRALRVLQNHGAERPTPELHRGFDRRFSKGVGVLCDDGIEIDTHRTLCLGALGARIPLDDLFAHPDHFTIGGRRFPAFSLHHRALHAAYHAVVGSSARQLRTLRDLAGYITRLPPDTLVPVAQQWRGDTVLHSAVSATFNALTFDAPAWREWTDRFVPDPGDLALIDQSQFESSWPLDVAFMRELTWRDRVAYTWGIATPSKETLESRGQTRFSRVRDGVAAIRSNR